jgi:predicted TIM-barrel fold metal-dependent hydrolase
MAFSRPEIGEMLESLVPFRDSGDGIIDSHAHFWSSDDVGTIVDEARRLGLRRVCVSSLFDWDWNEAPDPGAGNRTVFEAAGNNPELLGYVYLDPRFPDTAQAQIDLYADHPSMIGIKLWIACRANDHLVHPIAERTQRDGFLMLVHSWRRGSRLTKGHQTLPCQVAEMAASFPGVDVIMAHLGGDWESGIREVADAESVSVDTCGSINEAGMVEMAVEVLGTKRVLFGSDAPGSGYLPNIGKVTSARIEEHEKALILGGNMARLLEKHSRGI